MKARILSRQRLRFDFEKASPSDAEALRRVAKGWRRQFVLVGDAGLEHCHAQHVTHV